MEASTDEFEVLSRGGLYHPYRCGHWGRAWFILSTWGERTMKISQWKRCPDCMLAHFKESFIRCAVCGYHIAPGEGVALYSDKNEGFRPDATKWGENVLGCLRMDCCPAAAIFFAGHWTHNGFVPKFEGLTAFEVVSSTNRMLVVSDTHQ